MATHIFVGGLLAWTIAPQPESVAADSSLTDIIAFVVEGTGFGHGRGMSQWGAYGYAVDHDWTSEEILDHYYGGTVPGETSLERRIRVLLTDYDNLSTVRVISHGAGVQWGEHLAPSMRAIETGPGEFVIEQADTISCPYDVPVPQTEVFRYPSDSHPDVKRDVKRIQSFLLQFHNEETEIVVDGLWGPQTTRILSSWQKKEGLGGSGYRWTSDDWVRALEIIAATNKDVSWSKIGAHSQSPDSPSPIHFTTEGGDTQDTDRDAVLGVCSSNGRVTHYRGAIEVADTKNGVRVANDIPVEQYLRGVVPKEIPASWASAGDGRGRHAVQAQSIAARSYALSESRSSGSYMYRGSDERFADTCDTTSCQVYAGSASRSSATAKAIRVEQDATDAAILETVRQVRLWCDKTLNGESSTESCANGRIARTEFSASNGPRTAGRTFPVVEDLGDATSLNPNHRWTRILDAATFAAQHGLGRITEVKTVEPHNPTDERYDGIWYNDVVVTGIDDEYREDAWGFRNAYNLPSPGFTIRGITRSNINKTMAFIGDSVGNSITQGAVPELRRLTDGTFSRQIIEVADGRCTTKTDCLDKTGVEVAQSLPMGLDLVVVELGYNDTPSKFARDIDAMMSALNSRKAHQVVWINMADIRTSSDGSSVYKAANDALEVATGKWSNLTVLDWNAASDTPDRNRWFSSDGVHLTKTGQAQFALWIRTKLLNLHYTKLLNLHYLVPSKRIELSVVGEQLSAPNGSVVTVPKGVSAVAVNVTVVRPARKGYITVWPCTTMIPTTSNLNYVDGDIRANSIIAPVSQDGTICLNSSSGTHLIVDIVGWFEPTSADDGFMALEPYRLIDTRKNLDDRSEELEAELGGQGITPAQPLSIQIHSTTGVRATGGDITLGTDIGTVALNVAAVRPDGNGFLTIWPCDRPRPQTSNVNYVDGQTVSNGVIAPVGQNGKVCLYSKRPTHVIVDLMGAFVGTGNDASFRRAVPTRVADTRDETKAGNVDRLDDKETREIPIVGIPLKNFAESSGDLIVPAEASAAAVNITVVRPDRKGYATVRPCTDEISTDQIPDTSNLNYGAEEIVANNAVVPIGLSGSICVFTLAKADVILDVSGWFNDAGGFHAAVPKRLVDTRDSVGPAPS